MNKYIILSIIIIILIYKFSNPKKNLDSSSKAISNSDEQIMNAVEETPMGDTINDTQNNSINDSTSSIDFELNDSNIFSEDESVPTTTSTPTNYTLNNTNIFNEENINDDDFNIEEIVNFDMNIDQSQALPVYGMNLLNVDGSMSTTKSDSVSGYDSSINFNDLFYSDDITTNQNLTLNPQNDLIREMEYYENLDNEIDITKNQEGYWESLDREKFTNRTDKNEQICEINHYKNNNDQYVDMAIADVYDALTNANIDRTPLRHDDRTMMNDDNVPDAIYGGSIGDKLTIGY